MATLQLATVSNRPVLDTDRANAVLDLRAVLSNYFLGPGISDTVEATVLDDEPDPTLSIRGYGEFNPVSRSVVGEYLAEEYPDEYATLEPSARDDWVHEKMREWSESHYDAFLEDVSVFLDGTLVVQTVGYEKLRFPVVAHQHSVQPDGTIEHNQLG